MKILTRFWIAYFWIFTIALVGASEALSGPARPISIEMQRSVIDLRGDCRISLKLPANMKKNSVGSLEWYPMPSWWQTDRGHFQMNIECIDTARDDLPQTYAKFDEVKNIWRKDKDYLKNSILKVLHDPRNTSAAYQPENEKKYIDDIYKATDIHDIKTTDAHGWAEVAWSVPEADLTDSRYLSFCLFQASKAVCGSGVVAYHRGNPRSDVTRYVLDIVRSIEFLEKPTRKPESGGDRESHETESLRKEIEIQ